MMKTWLYRILCLMLLLDCSATHAQGSVFSSDVWPTVSLKSTPAGARVYLDGKLICASTPAVVTIPRPTFLASEKSQPEYGNYVARLVFKYEGYLDGEVELRPWITRGRIKNSYLLMWPKTVKHKFLRDPNHVYKQDPAIVAGEADNQVNRDKAGQSELERTIIRWYFDSDPRGARIFWRVISSVPAEVKNTNETYLMTTPFEETRSFNILGLTYENSRDVQIEIKVSKKGYEDQIKRFNVRQAIDQQEISAFFELVPKEQPQYPFYPQQPYQQQPYPQQHQ